MGNYTNETNLNDQRGDSMARGQLQTLTEPMYYILLSLHEERYGYEIMQIISEKTNGRLKVGPGTLYTLLARFADEGIIRQTKEVERRKVYIITDYGIELLEKEFERLKQLIKDGRSVLNREKEEVVEVVEAPQEEEQIFRKPSDSDIFF